MHVLVSMQNPRSKPPRAEMSLSVASAIPKHFASNPAVCPQLPLPLMGVWLSLTCRIRPCRYIGTPTSGVEDINQPACWAGQVKFWPRTERQSLSLRKSVFNVFTESQSLTTPKHSHGPYCSPFRRRIKPGSIKLWFDLVIPGISYPMLRPTAAPAVWRRLVGFCCFVLFFVSDNCKEGLINSAPWRL